MNNSAFRQSERKYRQRTRPLDLSDAIDASDAQKWVESGRIREYRIPTIKVSFDRENDDVSTTVDGDRNGFWTVYELTRVPGLFIIPSLLSVRNQWHLSRLALRDCTQPQLADSTSGTVKSVRTNLGIHWDVPSENWLWDMWRRERNGDEVLVKRREDQTLDGSSIYDSNSSNEPTENERDNRICPRQQQQQTIVQKREQEEFMNATRLFMEKLRWTNLGLHYDWTLKSYNHSLSLPLNAILKWQSELLVNHICTSLGIPASDPTKVPGEYFNGDMDTDTWNYQAEAGIINYYHLKDNLTAHIDRSEVNQYAPLISYSVGHACIYLIGGEDVNAMPDGPEAILVRSGDVLLMTGQSRKAFHGVPRIIEKSLPTWFHHVPEGFGDLEEWKMVRDYLAETRINLNLRQVY